MGVSWIDSSGIGNWKLLHNILEIRSLIGTMGQTQVEFSPRETNTFADLLAKKGAEGGRDLLKWNLI